MLSKSDKVLVFHVLQDGKNSSFPDELDVLLDRNFLFRFHISNYNIDKNWDHFTVLRISDDEELIKSFLEVNNDVEVNTYLFFLFFFCHMIIHTFINSLYHGHILYGIYFLTGTWYRGTIHCEFVNSFAWERKGSIKYKYIDMFLSLFFWYYLNVIYP